MGYSAWGNLKKDSQVIDRWIQKYLSDKNDLFKELSVWGGGKVPNLPSSDLNTGNTKISEIKKSFNILILGMNISGFPKIILNDRLLSSIYTSSDLEYIITDKVATLNDIISKQVAKQPANVSRNAL